MNDWTARPGMYRAEAGWKNTLGGRLLCLLLASALGGCQAGIDTPTMPSGTRTPFPDIFLVPDGAAQSQLAYHGATINWRAAQTQDPAYVYSTSKPTLVDLYSFTDPPDTTAPAPRWVRVVYSASVTQTGKGSVIAPVWQRPGGSTQLGAAQHNVSSGIYAAYQDSFAVGSWAEVLDAHAGIAMTVNDPGDLGAFEIRCDWIRLIPVP